MVDRVTVLQLIGREDDVVDFLEKLSAAGGDIALMIYWATFDTWDTSTTELQRAHIQAVVGPAVVPTFTTPPTMEPYHHLVSLGMSVSFTRHLLQEFMCLAALFDFELQAWFPDPVTGEGPSTSLQFASSK